MASDAVVKSVGKKLRYYFEVKRLEDGFDLSGVDKPALDHPRLKPRKTLQCEFLRDLPLKHHFKSPGVKVKLTQMPGYKAPDSSKERRVRKILEKYITKSDFTAVALKTWRFGKRPKKAWKPNRKQPVYMSNYSYMQTPKGRKLRPDASCALRSGKKTPLTGSPPVMRSVHPHYVTKKQASRMVTVASKLLVANEYIQDLKPKPPKSGTKPQSAPTPFETERALPHIYAESRPKTSRGFHGNNKTSEEGRDSAYTTDRNSPGSEDYHRRKSSRDAENRLLSPRSSDSDQERSPRPPVNQRPPGRRRPPSARTLNQSQIMDISHPPAGQVAVELGVQTRTSAVGIQTDSSAEMLDLENHLDKGENLVRSGHPVDYNVYVRTGKRIGASTKAEVKITLYGEKGRSQEFLLSESKRHKIKFQKGHEDLFSIHSPYVGPLKHVKIGHDRPELMFAWFLEGVTVEDLDGRRVYEFPCERWLSGQDGDKRTYRLLPLDRDRALIEDSDEGSSDVSYIKEYGKESVSENTEEDSGDSDQDSTDSVRARRSRHTSQRSKNEIETETESETDTDSTVSEINEKEVAIPVKPPTTEAKPTQTNDTSYRKDKPDLSPAQRVKDDFFDQRPAGPVYTFRTGTSVGSQDGDGQKLEFSDTESSTSRTYASDTTEAASVVLPNSTFPVITEETNSFQSPIQSPSHEAKDINTKPTPNTASGSQGIVPKISVEEVSEPAEPSVYKTPPPQQVSSEKSILEIMEKQDNLNAQKSETLDTSRSGSTTDRTTTDLTTESSTSRTESESETNRYHPIKTTTAQINNVKSQEELKPVKKDVNEESFTSESETERSSMITSSEKTETPRTQSEAPQPQPVKTQISQKTESGSDTEDSESDSSTDSETDSDSYTEGDTSRSEKSVKPPSGGTKSGETIIPERKESVHEAAKKGDLNTLKEILLTSPASRKAVNEVGWTALHTAASEGRAEVVKWLANSGDGLEAKTPTGYTAMHLAALYGYVNTLMVLSSCGAQVDCRTSDQQTPLHLAARSGDLGCVKWLCRNNANIEAKDQFGRKAKDLAEEHEQDDVVEFLSLCHQGKIIVSEGNLIEKDEVAKENSGDKNSLNTGSAGKTEVIKTEAEKPFEQKKSTESVEVVQSQSTEVIHSIPEVVQSQPDIVQSRPDVAAKSKSDGAVQFKQYEVVQSNDAAQSLSTEFVQSQSDEVVQSKADEVAEEPPSHHRHLSIHQAAKKGHLHRVQQIIRDFPDKRISVNEVGWTPLHIASAEGQTDVVRWLSESRQHLEKETPTGYTAMHLAALHGKENVMKALSSKGAQVNCSTTDGQTPLHLAAMSGYLNSVKWLVKNHVPVQAADSFGRTAMDLADENEHEDVVNFLKAAEDGYEPLAEEMNTTSETDEKPVNDSARLKSSEPVTSSSWESSSGSSSDSDEQTDDTPDPDLEMKRKMYNDQKAKMEETGTTFLDSIRQEFD